MTLAVEDVSTKNVDIVAVADGGGEETIDDRLVTVDNSATASKKPCRSLAAVFKFLVKALIVSLLDSCFGKITQLRVCALGDECILDGFLI